MFEHCRARIAIAAAVAVTAVAAGGLDAVTAVPMAVVTTEPGEAESPLPEGVYRTSELARDELVATGVDAGFDEADVARDVDGLGAFDTLTFSLRLGDGGWSSTFSRDGGPDEHLWRGTYEVVDDDTVVATDPCGSITYTFTFDGEELVLDMVDDQCEGGVSELIYQTIIYESAPFTLEAPAEPDTDAVGSASYQSTSFVVPFEVTLPEWVAPEPAAEMPNFVTWEGAAIDRGVRFLVPVNVYLPGETEATDVPDDYLAYLLSQAEHGAVFEDVVETTIDGRPATVLTATTDTGLDGSLGCQEQGMFAADCFGLQAELILRMAVVDTDAGPLLIWVRDIRGADDREIEYESFDAMLASLRFRAADTASSTAPAALVSSPIDGVWTMSLTRDELADSPLLYDEGELNNQSWGEFTLSFDNGRYVETQHNSEAVWAMTGSYAIDGDTLTLERENGEQFAMRWRVDGDTTLVLMRDDSLGIAPTPFVIKPWTRQS